MASQRPVSTWAALAAIHSSATWKWAGFFRVGAVRFAVASAFAMGILIPVIATCLEYVGKVGCRLRPFVEIYRITFPALCC